MSPFWGHLGRGNRTTYACGNRGQKMVRFVKPACVTLALVVAGSLGGCAETTLLTWSDDQMTAKTATAVGVPLDDVRLSDLDAAGPFGNVTYLATTRGGKKYHCTVTGLSPPTCQLQQW